MPDGEKDVSLAQPLDGQSPTEEPRRPRRPRPKHDFPQTQAGKMWEALGNPANPANEMPGGTFNSAGGRPREVSWRDAFRFDMFTSTKRPSYIQQPCARDSLLVGIGTGGAVGGLRFILYGLKKTWVTANFAVGGFALSSLGMFFWCNRRRQEEARGMAAAVAGMKMLHEKKAREEAEAKVKAEVEQAAQRQRQEEERQQRKPWYKVW